MRGSHIPGKDPEDLAGVFKKLKSSVLLTHPGLWRKLRTEASQGREGAGHCPRGNGRGMALYVPGFLAPALWPNQSICPVIASTRGPRGLYPWEAKGLPPPWMQETEC